MEHNKEIGGYIQKYSLFSTHTKKDTVAIGRYEYKITTKLISTFDSLDDAMQEKFKYEEECNIPCVVIPTY